MNGGKGDHLPLVKPPCSYQLTLPPEVEVPWSLLILEQISWQTHMALPAGSDQHGVTSLYLILQVWTAIIIVDVQAVTLV
ncbi:hypothetical protein PoB_007295200 [Plakobranchus ocellatus]|uniref:Uncharacterized protein n=1 Tax=Plakobranchus ocellatus TaxID=259542 RepID=A0AAV4DQR7_9GAST|nr:hypothetical protein PoB_007295200 [Plakobranchus ocellatus]